jgi:hypothetical protein
MKLLEKLEAMGLEYYIHGDHELTIYGEGDEYEEGNDKLALDEMREWAETNKIPFHDSSIYIDGYLVDFQDVWLYVED